MAAPSRWEEVYGLTVREARAAGLPVLAADVGDLAAVADGGKAGIVVPRDDEAAWVQALERFAKDAEARERWTRASEPRSTEQMTDQLERVYVELARDVRGMNVELPQRTPQKVSLWRRLFGR